jgi:hypothetical protein
MDGYGVLGRSGIRYIHIHVQSTQGEQASLGHQKKRPGCLTQGAFFSRKMADCRVQFRHLLDAFGLWGWSNGSPGIWATDSPGASREGF